MNPAFLMNLGSSGVFSGFKFYLAYFVDIYYVLSSFLPKLSLEVKEHYKEKNAEQRIEGDH